MTMMCGNCNRYGIVWVGPLTNLTGTKCPHCGGVNCQIPGEDEEPLMDNLEQMSRADFEALRTRESVG